MILNSVPVKVREKDYEMIVNIGAMLDIEKFSGKNFMEVLAETETGALTPTVMLLGSCLREGKKSVGVDFIADLSFTEMQELVDPLMQAISLALPKADPKNVVELAQKK